MYLAFCRDNHRSLIGLGIDAATGFGGFGGFYHTELVMFDGAMLTAMPDGGVKWRRRPEGYSAKSWSMIDLRNWDEDAIRDWADGEIGCGYDWWGDLRFVIPWAKPHKERWFCSELCATAIQQLGVATTLTPFKMSPNRLYRELFLRGYREEA